MNTGSPSRLARWRAPIGFAVGVLLIAAAVAVLVSSRESFEQSLDAAAHASWWLIGLMLLLPAGNAAVVSWSFQVLMNRFGRVPFGDMFQLICSAWLLNYLPMRPGFVGRLAYHKAVHRIQLKRSVAVTVALALMTGLAAAHLLVIGLAVSRGWVVGSVSVAVSSGAVVVLAGIAADRSPGGAVPRSALLAALALRYLDLALWVARMLVAFAIVGHPIPLTAAVLLSAAIQLAYLFPLTGSGLGVAEWAAGLVAAWSVAELDPADGIAASLVSRSAEIVVAVPLGLAGGAAIARKCRRNRARGANPADRHEPPARSDRSDPA